MFELWIKILLLSYVQSISFSIISRARNRNSIKYHVLAASGSNTIWYLTFRELVTNKMDWMMFLPYTIGTVAGSVTGAKVSMWFERILGASSDEHVRRTKKYIAVGPVLLDGSMPRSMTIIPQSFKNADEATAHLLRVNADPESIYILIDGEELRLTGTA